MSKREIARKFFLRRLKSENTVSPKIFAVTVSSWRCTGPRQDEWQTDTLTKINISPPCEMRTQNKYSAGIDKIQAMMLN